MNIAPIAYLFPSLYVMSDRGIRQALEQGRLIVDPLTDDQIQPASLDVRIGQVRVYDHEAMAKAAEQLSRMPPAAAVNYEPTTEFAKTYPDEDDIPIDIPPGTFAEVFFHEKIQHDSAITLQVDLRSSRGRLGLQLTSTYLEHDAQGTYVSLWNWNPNTIRLYGRTKFAQLFIHTNEPSDGVVCCDEYLPFHLGDHVYKFRQIGILDTKQKTPDEVLYEKLSTESVTIRKHEPTIVQLLPEVKIPANFGLKILHKIPYCQNPGHMRPDPEMMGLETMCANAGWVDPGYEGKITGHPMRTKFPVTLKKGDFIALGVVFAYAQSVLRPYGRSDLGSHYQKSDGTTSKS